MEVTTVGTQSFTVLITGTVLAFILPLAVALIWKIRKKERFTTILVGAATFLLFALILEKPIQALVISVDHPVKRFLDAYPVIWALVVALFPGVFEETGRLCAFRTVLKNRKNRETSISYGIGHGCFEVMIILGSSFITYIVYAIMINTGTFHTVVDQVAIQAPDQVDTLYALADQIAAFTVADLIPSFAERVFAVMFHIGASILVFYACSYRKYFCLYPLAIALHTILDFIAALTLVKVIEVSAWVLEGYVALFGIGTFLGAYLLLYRTGTEDHLRESDLIQP